MNHPLAAGWQYVEASPTGSDERSEAYEALEKLAEDARELQRLRLDDGLEEARKQLGAALWLANNAGGIVGLYRKRLAKIQAYRALKARVEGK